MNESWSCLLACGQLCALLLTTDTRIVQVADILLHFLTESNWKSHFSSRSCVLIDGWRPDPSSFRRRHPQFKRANALVCIAAHGQTVDAGFRKGLLAGVAAPQAGGEHLFAGRSVQRERQL